VVATEYPSFCYDETAIEFDEDNPDEYDPEIGLMKGFVLIRVRCPLGSGSKLNIFAVMAALISRKWAHTGTRTTSKLKRTNENGNAHQYSLRGCTSMYYLLQLP